MLKLISGALVAAAFLAAPAGANDTADSCRAYVSENGGDASGCDCLGEAASSDGALADALAAIEGPDDLEAASDQTKQAIAACFPNASQG